MDKKVHVKDLIGLLDEVFSVFIRKRETDESGHTKCFTCSKVDHWTKLQAGHYYSRKHYGTRWDEKNVQTQCVKCNIYSQGAGPDFAKNLIKKYGAGIINELSINKNRRMNLGPFEISILIEKYKDL